MSLEHAIRDLARVPTDLKARANLAGELENLGAPEAASVWYAAARLAGGRGQFSVALALGRRYLEGQMLEDLLMELARRFGVNRPRNGPLVSPPRGEPVEVEVPEDPDEQVFVALRLGTDIDALMLPRFARLPDVPIFSELPESEFVALSREVEAVALEEGMELARQDSMAREVFVLVRGEAEGITRRPDGEDMHLGVAAGPTVLGEMSLLTAVPRRSTLTALGPGLAWRIDSERLIELAAEQPVLINRLRTLVKQRLLSNLLGTSRILAGVDNKEHLLAAFAVKTLPPATQVFRQGAAPPGLFFILHGKADVWVEAPDGGKNQVAVLTEGDAFGEMSLLTGEPTTASVRMPEGGIVLHLSARDYKRIRGEAAALTEGLSELMDVRRGELDEFLAAEQHVEFIEELDAAWVLELQDD